MNHEGWSPVLNLFSCFYLERLRNDAKATACRYMDSERPEYE